MTNIERIYHGDSLDVLKTMEDNSVDSVVTDPPYGLSKEPNINEVLTKWLAGEEYDHGHGGFMGKSWDSFVPHPDIWREVYRVLKPGGHALVFAGTRTQDLMTISLRLAGFEVRDVIEWIYFSGFPKSHDVSKAFDRRIGAKREVVGIRNDGSSTGSIVTTGTGSLKKEVDITIPATELARKWDGWGTNLKPSHEPIIVVRKPLIDADTGRKLTVADCVEKYGTGAINIDGCRIALGDEKPPTGSGNRDGTGNTYVMKDYVSSNGGNITPEQGRFPANCITLDGDAFYSKYFNVANITPAELSKKASKKDRNSDWKGEEIGDIPSLQNEHRFGRYRCETCGKLQLDHDPCSCENPKFKRVVVNTKNSHPTVKPTDLMAWLVRLVTPPNGTVLDPFAGSGSTLVAAKREGFGFIGVELTDEYIPIIEARTGVGAIKAEANEGQATE